MLQRLVNALRGNVRLEVEGAFPDLRVLAVGRSLQTDGT